MQKDYAEILLQAVDQVVSERIKGISYDVTDTVEITNADDASKGKYKVSDGAATYYAYSSDTTYEVGDVVYMTVPNGDYTKQKIIIGKYVAENDKPFVFQTPFQTLVDTTGNIIDKAIGRLGLIANNPKVNSILLWRKDFEDDNTQKSGYTRVGIQAQFMSWLGELDCVQGDYGLLLALYSLRDSTNNEYKNLETAWKRVEKEANQQITVDSELGTWLVNTQGIQLDENFWELELNKQLNTIQNKFEALKYQRYDLYLSSNDMYGDPFNYTNYYQQEQVFDISNLGTIICCELYFYETPNTFKDKKGELIDYLDDFENLLLPNLFIKDPYICFGYNIAEFEDESFILFTDNKSTYSSKNSDEENKKIVSARWFHNGNVYETNIDEPYEIRWYRYALGAPSADEYSGVYWKRVNDKLTYKVPMPEIEAIDSFPTAYINNNERKYTQNFVEVKANSASYAVKFFSQNFLKYYNISEEVIEYGFYQYQGYQTAAPITIVKNELQNWTNLYDSAWSFHDKTKERFSGWPKNMNIANAPDDSSETQLIKGCIHYLGFWERFSLAYRLYWLAPEAFDELGVSSIWRFGGEYGDTIWEKCKGKNPYTEFSYNYGYSITGEDLLRFDTDGARFTIDKSSNQAFVFLLTCFTNSFGEWEMTEPNEFGITDYRPKDEETYQNLLKLGREIFEKLDNPYKTIDLSRTFNYIFNPDTSKEQEQVKAILLLGNDNGSTSVYRSNILTFTNEQEVVNEATKEFVAGLNIWCADGTYGNYYIYDPGNKILEQFRTTEAHKLMAMFSAEDTLLEQETAASLLTEAEEITWTFSTTNTMIQVNNINYTYSVGTGNNQKIIVAPENFVSMSTNSEGLYEFTLADGSKSIYDPEEKTISITRYGDTNNGYKVNAEQYYFVKESYSSTNYNNVIQCRIKKNGKEYYTSKRLMFGQAGTTGTDVTLRLYFDPAFKHALRSYNDKKTGDTLKVRAILYDSQNQEIDLNETADEYNAKVEWSWYVADGTPISILPTNSSVGTETNYNVKINDKYYNSTTRNEVILESQEYINIETTFLILQVTIKDWGNYDLTVRRPIPIAADSFTTGKKDENDEEIKYYPVYVNCAEEVIYTTTGYPNYYREPWQLHYALDANSNSSMDILEGTWSIIKGDSFSGSFDEKNILTPLGFYVKSAEQYGAQFKYNDKILWTQPIYICQNNYPSTTLNEWNGSDLILDEDKSLIMATSIAAGVKNSDDNTFSGVILGKWKDGTATEIAAQTGIYGFYHGATSYGFKEDGTGFIGKSDKGRILFDGNKSTITSNLYANGGKTAGAKGGMYLDFDDGLIKLVSPENIVNQITINVSDKEFPFRIGQESKFKVAWDGTMYATNGNFSGSIDASEITGTTIKGSTITASSEICIPDSKNYVFKVDSSGKLEASSADITGKITANSGEIGGFVIGTTSLYSKENNNELGNAKGVFLGSDSTFSLGDKFVFKDSKLFIAANIYREEATAAGEAYFLIGINNSDKSRLQIGSPNAGSGYTGGVSIYGNNAIYLVANGKDVEYSSEKRGLQLTSTEARLYGYSADNQHGIYARFA